MDETRLKRARFRAWRRGFQEADLLLGPFADTRAPRMTSAEFERFERLLEQPDHDIFGWIMETAPTPPEFDNDIMAWLRAARSGAG